VKFSSLGSLAAIFPMHWLYFPICLFNIEIRELETGKAISRSEPGPLPTNGSYLLARQGAGQHVGTR
jgi:hypothetical protein